MLSDDLGERGPAQRRTLEEWQSRDLQTNSFVHDPSGDAAIFLYLDPGQAAAKFENTVAHELHHIGFANISQPSDSVASSASPGVRTAVAWLRAFGEGFAMLAAAGDPGTHPHAVSRDEERARWDRSMANFNQDLRRLEEFFLEVMDGRLSTEAEVRERAMSFFGEQGPWYTVGYRMAVTVERRYGRAVLIESMVDPRQLLTRYNAAAAEQNAEGVEHLALWSPRLTREIGAPEPEEGGE